MPTTRTLDERLDARVDARASRDFRAYEAMSRREDTAARMVGTLIRNGSEVRYISPVDGKYREGTESELVAFLIRNNYDV